MKKTLLFVKNAFLAIAVALLTVCLGFAIKSVAPSGASAATAPNLDAAATYCLGESGQNDRNVYYYKDMAEGWAAAVRHSLNPITSNSLVKVVLYRDWTAGEDGNFGEDATAFSRGRIHVPTRAHIWLDLNGNTINRALTEGRADGNVISVGGTLELESESGEGTVTGAYNTNGNGGALIVQSGTVNMRKNVAISGNKVSGDVAYGAGVFLSGGATLNIYNGKIAANEIVGGRGVGGGVAIYDDATFNMYGGTISGNGAEKGVTTGGGVGIATSNSVSQPTVNFAGGTVSGNGAEDGGALAVAGSASVTVNGTEFSGNTATNGGAIALVNAAAKVSFASGTVTGNTATAGGGVYVRSGSFEMTGGRFAGGNTASQTGAAIAVTGGSVKLTGGSVAGNAIETDGCAIIAVTGGSLEMAGYQVSSNSSKNGAILFADGDVTLASAQIFENRSDVGAVVLGENANLKISGNTLISGNGSVANAAALRNLVLDETGKKPVFEKLGASASIGMRMSGDAVSKATFSAAFGKNNYKEGTKDLYLNPMETFTADVAGQRFVLDEDGNIVGTDKTLAITVNYDGGEAETFLFGETRANAGTEYVGFVGKEFVYGEKTIASIVASEGGAGNSSDFNTAAEDAGEYKAIYNGAYLFTVVITPYAVGQAQFNCAIAEAEENIFYTGDPVEPTVSVNVNRDSNPIALTAGTDYTVKYENNVDAGRASATVTLKGNYTGTYTLTFNILPAAGTYQLEWQYYSAEDAAWKKITDFDNTFFYNPDLINQNDRIRAQLTAGDEIETVYMSSVRNNRLPVADENRNTDMQLVLSRTTDASGNGTASVTSFDQVISKGLYYVFTIQGTGNFTLPSSRTCKVVMNELTIEIDPEEFETAESDQAFLLINGNEGFANSYVDIETNETVEAINSVAHYTGSPIELEVNAEYAFSDGLTVGRYLQCTVESVNETDAAAGTTGAAGKVHTIKTTITVAPRTGIRFGGDGAQGSFELTKTWYIVTFNNVLLNENGGAATFTGWDFCVGNDVASFRPEHGDTVIYTYTKLGVADIVRQFAVVYENDEMNSPKKFYEVTTENGALVPDTTREIEDGDYFRTFNKALKAGSYTLRVLVPASEATGGAHNHWWESGRVPIEDLDTMYNEVEASFSFMVRAYTVSGIEEGGWNVGFTHEFITDSVEYNGRADNTPELSVTLHGVPLVEGVDYLLTSSQINVGTAELTIEGIESLTGQLKLSETYRIVKARNSWAQVPNVMNWTFGNYDESINVFEAMPALLDADTDLVFSISTDAAGEELVAGLESFSLHRGIVPDSIAVTLKDLPAGIAFYLHVKALGNDNYYALDAATVEFRVFTANNYWEVTPGITSWTTGKYDGTRNTVQGTPRFGAATIVIKDAKGNVVYQELSGTVTVDELASAKAGNYTLTASVAGSNDYSSLAEYTFNFRVFNKAGIAWWGILLIVIAALAVAAGVLFILWKKGVFQILTNKVIVAIRTKATVDAAVAAVRANKAEAQARAALAAAEAAERARKRKQALEAAKNMTIAERAAALEKKASEAEEYAEKMRRRAAEIQEGPEKANEKPAEETAKPEAAETEKPAEETAKPETAETEKPAEEAATGEAAASDADGAQDNNGN